MEENQKNDNNSNIEKSDNENMQDFAKQYPDVDDSIFYLKQDFEHPAFQDIDNIIAQLSSQANQEEPPAEFSEEELQEELVSICAKEETVEEFQEAETQEPEEEQTEQSIPKETISEKSIFQQDIKEEQEEPEKKEEPVDETRSKWEELSKDNQIVKKYIIYVSKDFIPIMDKMTTDERTAYINDAIQQKLDKEDAKKQLARKQKLALHLIVAIFVAILISPLAVFTVHKAIMATFENYRYSQENFEKLYKQRFEHDRAYMRSVQYNKEMKEKLKNSSAK